MPKIKDYNKKFEQVRKNLEGRPHIYAEDVDFVVRMNDQMEQQEAAKLAKLNIAREVEPPKPLLNEQMELAKKPFETSYNPSTPRQPTSNQNSLNSPNSNASNNSMLINAQTTNVNPAIANEAAMRVQQTKPVPERMLASRLKASDNLVDHLKNWETNAPIVADDGFGNPTGGYGHVEGGGDAWFPGMSVPKAYANQLLAADVKEAERAVQRLTRNIPLKQQEYDALVDLVFNVGATNANVTNSPRLNKAIKERNYPAIATNLLYSKEDGNVVKGLKNRSKSRADIFSSGIYGKKY